MRACCWRGPRRSTSRPCAIQSAWPWPISSTASPPCPWCAACSAPRPTLADIGSGGGYPGLPLAIVLPASRAVLIESVGKKARFLDVAAAAVARALGPDGPTLQLRVERRRAESLAGGGGRSATFDLVTVRAVGSLARVATLGLPLLRPGGLLVAWKRDGGDGALQAEVQAARPEIARLGGTAPRLERVPVPPGVTGLEGHRLVLSRQPAGAATGDGSRLLGWPGARRGAVGHPCQPDGARGGPGRRRPVRRRVAPRRHGRLRAPTQRGGGAPDPRRRGRRAGEP